MIFPHNYPRNLFCSDHCFLPGKRNSKLHHILYSGAFHFEDIPLFIDLAKRNLAGHIKKDYQINALQKLTGIGEAVLASSESTALYLEQWLLELEQDTSAAAGRLISGFSHLTSRSYSFSSEDTAAAAAPLKYASYLFGNAGKRKAVEQFFFDDFAGRKASDIAAFF